MRLAPLIALCLTFSACAADRAAQYGVPARFSRNAEVAYPDLTIRYLGDRKVSVPQFPRGFTYYDFEIRSGGETKTVSWSSGTGVIDSASFEIAGRPYELELRGSVARKGWLRDDEMVLWPRAEFLKALEKSR